MPTRASPVPAPLARRQSLEVRFASWTARFLALEADATDRLASIPALPPIRAAIIADGTYPFPLAPLLGDANAPKSSSAAPRAPFRFSPAPLPVFFRTPPSLTPGPEKMDYARMVSRAARRERSKERNDVTGSRNAALAASASAGESSRR